ncbi:MAG: endonuclease/exonuclease/phosphatase family protein, partial [Cyanobacteria bacterium J06553_1]
MRGCGMDEKKCMIVDIFKERKLDVMALCETKVKGQGVQEWEGERVIVSGVSERCRAREGVAVVISGRLWGRVREYKCLNSRIMWVKLKMNGEKIVIVSVYGPGMEKSENERERFWDNLNECLAGFDEEERIIVLGDMNAKVGDREKDGVVGKFGVPGINENGECLVEMCAERDMIVGNTWFQKKLIYKYTWEREHGDERSLIDYILIERKFKSRLKDVSVHRGAAAGLSNHYLVEAKVRIEGYN